MKCPRCSGRYLSVEVSFKGMVPCTFGAADDARLTDATTLSSEWGDTSRCECLICHWAGTVGETQLQGRPRRARPAPPPAEPRTAKDAGSADLDEIRALLKVRPCPSVWKAHLSALTGEVERLRAVIDAMARVSAPRRRRGGSEDDTVVG